METAYAVITVFADHHAAETAVKKLTAVGFAMNHLRVVGKGYRTEGKVVGFYNVGDTANRSRLDLHAGVKAIEPADHPVHASD